METFPYQKTRYPGRILINHQKTPDERVVNPSAPDRSKNHSAYEAPRNQGSISLIGSSCCSEEFAGSLACTNHSNSSAPVPGQWHRIFRWLHCYHQRRAMYDVSCHEVHVRQLFARAQCLHLGLTIQTDDHVALFIFFSYYITKTLT